MKKIFTIIILLMLMIILYSEIPDIYQYKPIPGDGLDIFLLDKTTVHSFGFRSNIEYDNYLILKLLNIERGKAGMEEESDFKADYFPWQIINTKDMTLGEISKEINRVYEKEFDIDSVFVTIGIFGDMNKVAVSIGSGRSNYISFQWGKTFRYYINFVEARILSNEPNTVYIIREGKEDMIVVDLDDIVLPKDQIFLYPQSISVRGNVNYQRDFPYTPGFTIKEYIGLAGGISDNGDLSKVTVTDENGKRVKSNEDIKPGYSLYIGKSFLGIAKDVSLIISIFLGIYSIITILTPLIP